MKYTEDTLVQQTTAEYLEQHLGWESIYAYNTEVFGRPLPSPVASRHPFPKGEGKTLICDLGRASDRVMNLVEQIGSGIRRIRRMCKDYGVAVPEIEVSEHWVTMIFKRQIDVTPRVTGQVTGQVGKLLRCLKNQEMSRKEIMEAMHLKGRDNFEKQYLRTALENSLIERTIPEKPNSRLQKYRLTKSGEQLMEKVARSS